MNFKSAASTAVWVLASGNYRAAKVQARSIRVWEAADNAAHPADF